MQLIVASSGSLLLSNDLLLRFKSKNEFILGTSKPRQLKKKVSCLVGSEIILVKRYFIIQLVFKSSL